jgi:hypothetical protein
MQPSPMAGTLTPVFPSSRNGIDIVEEFAVDRKKVVSCKRGFYTFVGRAHRVPLGLSVLAGLRVPTGLRVPDLQLPLDH